MTDQRRSANAGDTWGITTSLGATALGVAAYRAAETVQPEGVALLRITPIGGAS